MRPSTDQDELSLSGDRLVAKAKTLIHAGNVRRVVIRDKEGKEVFGFPLTVGVIATILFPPWVIIALAIVLASELTIAITQQD